MHRGLLFLLALVCLPGVTLACINDSELPLREREFRSQYLDSKFTSTTPPAPSDLQYWVFNLSGGAMLATGLVVAIRLRPGQPATKSAAP
ncbi:MAG: hypothetical protein ACKOEO_16010 [Planctomycetaceae bacterium]